MESAVQRTMAPSGTRFEVEKFNGTGSFGLWQTRVKDLFGTTGMLEGVAGSHVSSDGIIM